MPGKVTMLRSAPVSSMASSVTAPTRTGSARILRTGRHAGSAT